MIMNHRASKFMKINRGTDIAMFEALFFTGNKVLLKPYLTNSAMSNICNKVHSSMYASICSSFSKLCHHFVNMMNGTQGASHLTQCGMPQHTYLVGLA